MGEAHLGSECEGVVKQRKGEPREWFELFWRVEGIPNFFCFNAFSQQSILIVLSPCRMLRAGDGDCSLASTHQHSQTRINLLIQFDGIGSEEDLKLRAKHCRLM